MANRYSPVPAILGYTQTKVVKNFIDGEWVESSTGETFEDRNPAETREVVGIFQKSAKADVDALWTRRSARSPSGGWCPRRGEPR